MPKPVDDFLTEARRIMRNLARLPPDPRTSPKGKPKPPSPSNRGKTKSPQAPRARGA